MKKAIELEGLYSTNENEKREVHVNVKNNSDKTDTARLKFDICDEMHEQSVQLSPNEKKKVSQPHKKSGLCNVTVRELNHNDEKTRLLDLDKPIST